MVHMTPGDLPNLPVEQLAQFLLGCAREDPSLLARSATRPAVSRALRARAPDLPVMAAPMRLTVPDPALAPELEELVTIALACARRAEDAVEHAREVSRLARRRMSVVAAVTGAGVLAASVAIVLDKHAHGGESLLTEIGSALHRVSTEQPSTETQLAKTRPDAARGDSVPRSAELAAPVPARSPAASAMSGQAGGSEPRADSVASAEAAAPRPPDPAPARVQLLAPPRAQVPPPPRVQVPAPPGLGASAATASEPAQSRSGAVLTRTADTVGPPHAVSETLAPDPDPAPADTVIVPKDLSPSPSARAAGQSTLTEPKQARPAVDPPQPATAARHHYGPPRPRYREMVAYRSSPQPAGAAPRIALAEVVANVRRNLYSIFH